MAKCIKCGVKEGDYLTFDNRREVDVKLSNGRYGKLCQRCSANAYARTVRKNKRQRKQEVANVDDYVQMAMFEDGE